MPEEDNNIAVGLVPEPVKYTTTQEELKMPTQGLIIVDPKPEDYVFGGSPLTKVILRPDGQHDAYLPVVEIQRLRDGVGEDSFWCVACSGNSCKEITHKEMYGYEINMDDQYTAIGSGTIRGQGNSVAKVAEWARKNSFIKEKNRIRFAKSLDEIYVPVTGEELAEGKKNLELYEFGYEWLPRPFNTASCTPAVLMDALKCAPIQVSVDGSGYQFNNQGYIGSFVNYTHEVLIFGYVEGQFWKIFDSETEQALKFAWSYPFGFPMIHSIKKKNMQMFRKNGQAAIGFVNESKDGLILWTDGRDNQGREVTGGSIFKTMGFNYALAEPCDEWPLPIVGNAKVVPQI